MSLNWCTSFFELWVVFPCRIGHTGSVVSLYRLFRPLNLQLLTSFLLRSVVVLCRGFRTGLLVYLLSFCRFAAFVVVY